jgi:hypothetical protein
MTKYHVRLPDTTVEVAAAAVPDVRARTRRTAK